MRADRKDVIMAELHDLVQGFVRDDRREDEELPEGSIADAISEGEVTVDELVERFRELLEAEVG